MKYLTSELILVVTISMFSVCSFAEKSFQLNGTDVSRDSLKKDSGSKRKTDTEKVITFNETNLAPANVRMVFNELFRQYITIKDALVYNDPYNAKRNTLKLLDDMRSKTKDFWILDNDDRWVFFINNYENIRRKVESASFISEQRSLFNEVSGGLGNFIKQFGLYDKKIYLMKSTSETQFGNNEWLSDSKDKKNPYLGLINDTNYVKVKETWKF